jgi:DNA-binding PadR family transcriptional regulator
MSEDSSYPLIKRLIKQGLITKTNAGPGKRIGPDRTYYRITPAGLDRLKQELSRLKHAVKIGQHAGLMDDDKVSYLTCNCVICTPSVTGLNNTTALVSAVP